MESWKLGFYFLVFASSCLTLKVFVCISKHSGGVYIVTVLTVSQVIIIKKEGRESSSEIPSESLSFLALKRKKHGRIVSPV